MIDKILKDLKEYFDESSIYIDMNATNENKIRLGCSKTKVYLNLYWEDIFYLIDEEKRFEGINSFIYSSGVINKMANIEKLFGYISYDMLYSYHNKKLKLWGYELNSLKGRYIQGFYKDNYAEFSIQSQVDFRQGDISIKDLACNFQMGNVKINISYPSDIYRLIFQQTRPLMTFWTWWDKNMTISLKKDDKSKLKCEETEKYLQQALFILNFFYPKVFVFGSSNNNNVTDLIKFKKKFIGEVPESKHIVPIIYYNEGINSTKETAFYYFYKVLEYYFNINIKEIIKQIIDRERHYKDNLNKESLDDIADNIIKLSTNNKEMKLRYLLSNKNIIDDIKEIMKIYFYETELKDINYYARKIYI